VRYSVSGPAKDLMGQTFRILLADPMLERARSFRVQGDDWWLTIASDYQDMLISLEQDRYDLALVACFYSPHGLTPQTIAAALITAYTKGKLKGVVLTAPSTTDGLKQLEYLRAAGVPVKYYPYNYLDLSKHEEYGVTGGIVAAK